ncbi:MAG: alkaline phosphatase family protein [Chloroflexota bacterium]|nr:alkaline phosphatase family protein [Chloroflexota bacterium]
MAKHVLVLDLVCLTLDHLANRAETPTLNALRNQGYGVSLRPPFPAVTCTSQATLTTGTSPREHGVVCNGMFERDRYAIRFWDQPTSMVKRPKVWERLRERDPAATTALLFFQNTMFASADVVVTPAPIHLDEGLVPWCYSKPVGYYEQLVERQGPFQLPWYWGPLAGVKASEWIADATLNTLELHRPTLTFAYLPHLDYNTQRFGSDSAQFHADLVALDGIVARILDGLDRLGLRKDTAIVLLSEYAMTDVSRPVLLNRELRRRGLVDVRVIGGKEYLDVELSPAVAMVDHQMAHVFVKPDHVAVVRAALVGVPGVERVLDREEQRALEIDHPSSGELIAIAESDAWFAYYWWLDDELAPPYAREIDIHRKPAYDPVELFFDPATKSIPLKPELVRGSHGRPPDLEPRRPALIVAGAGADGPPGDELDMRAVPELILSLLGHGR